MRRKGKGPGWQEQDQHRRPLDTTDYRHTGVKRKNVPPATIAAEGTVPKVAKARYAYSPHLPPVLRFDGTGKADALPGAAGRGGEASR